LENQRFSDPSVTFRESPYPLRSGSVIVAASAKHSGTWEVIMRGIALFVAGLVVGGIAVHSATAQNSSLSPNKGVVGLNHVGIIVPDLDKAVEYYTKTLGFPEAFRSRNEKGEVQLVYVQISKNTFVEIQPANGRPTGISHFGVVVDDMKQAN